MSDEVCKFCNNSFKTLRDKLICETRHLEEELKVNKKEEVKSSAKSIFDF